MNQTNTVPVICAISLAAMAAAGASHWWSVKQFLSTAPSTSPIPAKEKQQSVVESKIFNPETSAPTAQQTEIAPPTPSLNGVDLSQQKFYETLVDKMERLQIQNRDLLDQLAETNRDLMKLEFRVDTHSESFRPLPVSEQFDTSFDDSPGVLPPRAEALSLPFDE